MPCNPKTPINPCLRDSKQFDSLDAMAAHYRKYYESPLIQSLKALNTYKEFICGVPEEADAQGCFSYKKSKHQRRMPSTTVDIAYEMLWNAMLDRYGDFQSVLKEVTLTSKKIPEFGILACYDFSLRYCYNRGIEPDIVYLHAGVSDGVRALKMTGYKLEQYYVDGIGKVVKLNSLPSPIASLGAMHAENFLCIFKKHFSNLKNTMQK